MKILLDTTYFLPLIGISVKGVPNDALIRLLEKGHQISLSDITIFELSAKGGKYVTAGALTPERVSRGIRSIIYDERITRIPMYDDSVLLVAFGLRRMLSDFIDCLILSSAINQNETLVTEDDNIHRLGGEREFHEFLEMRNRNFRIRKLREML